MNRSPITAAALLAASYLAACTVPTSDAPDIESLRELGKAGGSSSSSSSSGAPVDAAVHGETLSATVRQWGQASQANDSSESVSVTLQPLAAGDALIVFATAPNFNGSPIGSGAPSAIKVTDSAGDTYALLNVDNDSSNGIWQAGQSFAALDVRGTTGDVTVTASYPDNT